MTFQDLNLTTPLLNALEEQGLTTPTPIQEQSSPVILSGQGYGRDRPNGDRENPGILITSFKDFKIF